MGSVLALNSFKIDFGLPLGKSGFASDKNSQVSSNVVSLLTAGCFFGAIAAAFINDRLGRRYSLMIFTLIFMVGAAVQVAAHHEIGMIYGGRVIAGLGIGGMSSITPVFVSENAPAQYRGRIAGLFQEFLVIGSTFAYWLGYGVSLHMPANTKQWRVPVAIQLIPGGLMFIGLFFLKESSRWLMKQGRREEAVQSLAYIRNAPENSEEVQKEIAEIYAAIVEETALTEGVTWKECLQKSNRYRFFVAFCMMFCQQFSGTNSIGYYAPQIFQSIGISSSNSSLFATGIYGTVKVISTAIFLFIGIDRWGRKRSLMGGAAWMAVMMFIIGAVLATHPPDTTSTVVSRASIAMVTMIYLYVIGYSFSWGPTPWVYLGEVCFSSFLKFFITTFANPVFFPDLPYSSPLIRCRSRSCHPVVVQLCHHRDHSSCHPQHWLEDLHHVRRLLHCKWNLCDYFREGNQGPDPGRDGPYLRFHH
jgi:sugar porter (SP) family MFS transporter